MRNIYVGKNKVMDVIEFLENHKYDNILTGDFIVHHIINDKELMRIEEYVWEDPDSKFHAELCLEFDNKKHTVTFADFYVSEYGTGTRVNFYSNESKVIEHLLSYYSIIISNNRALEQCNEIFKFISENRDLFKD